MILLKFRGNTILEETFRDVDSERNFKTLSSSSSSRQDHVYHIIAFFTDVFLYVVHRYLSNLFSKTSDK